MPPKKSKKPKKNDQNLTARISGTSYFPMLAPPLVLAEDVQWYRMASDALLSEEDEQAADQSTTQLVRQEWGNQIEFLMSCIATSVGLGNVWRFAFVAYQNGGGAFLIPYIIVLFLIGKPMYYLECIIGQFSSRNSVRMWSCVPGMKGTGYAQAICIIYMVSYYVALVALCFFYLVNSFKSPLPWVLCEPQWDNCISSDPKRNNETFTGNSNGTSSAELYFVRTVLQQLDGIEGGLGAPIWYLVVCLLVSWILIFLIVARGVKSSGKAAYFLALFPYVVLIILLVSTLILPGAGKGILFFITPQWEKILRLDVWYAAVTQVFFSLTVGTGPIIMFSSYNSFTSNVHRDSLIVTTLDTLTSLLSGFTIFGILGNLAHELNSEIVDVVGAGGTGLAFISYPDAIAKTFMPQVFSVLFFVMMVVLGIGSSVALLSTVNTICLDAFTNVRAIYITLVNCTLGFLSGIVYLTPGGQYILELVDYYGATFLALFCAICEVVGIIWIYGLENVCLDLEYMLRIKTSMYWRLCWGVITPFMMIIVFVYALFNFQALLFGGYYTYPKEAYIAGYVLLFTGIICVPLFICFSMRNQKVGRCCKRFKKTFEAKPTWGPRNRTERKNWKEFKTAAKRHQQSQVSSKMPHICRILTGTYRKGLDPGQGEFEETPIFTGETLGEVEKTGEMNEPMSIAKANEAQQSMLRHLSKLSPSTLSRASQPPTGTSPPPGSTGQSTTQRPFSIQPSIRSHEPPATPQPPESLPPPGSPEPPGSLQPPGSPQPPASPQPSGLLQPPGLPPPPGSPEPPGSPQPPVSPEPPGSPQPLGSPEQPGSPQPPDSPPPSSSPQ